MIRSGWWAAAMVVALVTVFGVGAGRLSDESTMSTKVLAAAADLSSSTTTVATAPAPPPEPRSVTIAFTGDLLPHGPVVARAAALADGPGHDFAPMFELVRPVLAGADVAICHLETPLSVDGQDLSGYPTFNAPRSLAEAVAEAGYDGCSTASNHSWDRGRQGVLDTLRVLDETGLKAAGTSADRIRPAWYRRNGLQIAHLAYTYGLNGFRLPSQEPWLVNLIDPTAIARSARLARSAGADLVVVSLHWGSEYRIEPTTAQVDLVKQLLPREEIDLIVGHHAHVVQPVDRRAGKVVLYGLGNFLSNQSGDCCTAAAQDGVIALVTLTERGDRFRTRVEYVPTFVDRSTFTIVPATPGPWADQQPALGPRVLQRSRQRTGAALTGLDASGISEWRSP